MWITNQFVDRPGMILFVGFSILILFTIITVSLNYFELDTGGDRDFMVFDHEITEDYEAYYITKKHISDNEGKEIEPIRSERGDRQYMIYMTKAEQAEGKGLLAQSKFKAIADYEEVIS